jgi:hypothetical protein
VPRPAEQPRPQLGYRREREKQRAAWRRGSMIRASSMPRLRVRAINWNTFMTHYELVTNVTFCVLGDLDPPVCGHRQDFCPWPGGRGGQRGNLLADLR